MAHGRAVFLVAVVVVFAPGRSSAIPLWQEAVARGGSGNEPVAKAETLPDFARLAGRATEAVVSISTVQQPDPGEEPLRSLLDPEGSEPQKGLGSGFFIHPDGYFVTNAHVIEDVTGLMVSVRRDGHVQEYSARVVGVDTPTDVALLKLDAEPGETFPVLPLGDSDALEVAEWIAAIGNPYGLSHSVTVGVVSYKGRTDVMPAGREGYYDYIQTDASINPGNSGGPILNARGEVIGIANAVNAVGQGIGFAIPINMAKQVLAPLLRDGRVSRSWIGITVEDLTPELAREKHLPQTLAGVLVSEVLPNAPGAEAGLQVGDVITSFDGQKVGDAQRLRWLAAVGGVGKEVPIAFKRKGEDKQVKARLTPMPEQRELTVAPPLTEVGLVVSTVDVPTAREAGLALPIGASVREVRGGSAAERAGVKKGDIVLKVDDLEIRSPGALTRAVAKVDSGDFARLVLRRGNHTIFMSLKKP